MNYNDFDRLTIINECNKRGFKKTAQYFDMKNLSALRKFISEFRKREQWKLLVPRLHKIYTNNMSEKKLIFGYCTQHGYEKKVERFKYKKQNKKSIPNAVRRFKKQFKQL